jgi:hypothetical protein
MMTRFASMTIGLILVFVGIQLFMVKSYLLSPTATRFLAEHMGNNSDSRFSMPDVGATVMDSSWQRPGQSWPWYRPSQGAGWTPGQAIQSIPGRLASAVGPVPPGYQHRLVPPQWIMWPALFLGTVFFLHGLALRN